MNYIKHLIFNSLARIFLFRMHLKKKDKLVRHWIVPVIFLINFLKTNAYISTVIQLTTLGYKLYADKYLTDRYVSVIVFLITVLLQLSQQQYLIGLLQCLIIYDTVAYEIVEKRRDLNDEYFYVAHSFSNMAEQEYYFNDGRENYINVLDEVSDGNEDDS